MDWKVLGKFSLAGSVLAAALIFSFFAIHQYRQVISGINADGQVRAMAVAAARELPPEPRAAALLELEIINRRYGQAEAAMLSRLWTRSMGFVTGMMLSLIGAAFVLGELRIDPSKVEGGSENLKLAISSSSPGLILCLFGVALIGISLTISYNVTAQDVPVYFRQTAGPTPDPPAAIPLQDGSAGPITSKDVENVQEQIDAKLAH